MDRQLERSYERVELEEKILEQILLRGRGLLYAYGAHNAQASCPLAANVPILPSTSAVAPFDVVDEEKNAGVPDDNTAEDGGAAEQEWEGTITAQDAEKWGLSLTEPVHNLFLSRHTVHSFIFPLVKARASLVDEIEMETRSNISFWNYVQKNVPPDESKPNQFFASVLWAIYEYSAEPTFLAYRLLLEDQINEHCVLDNQAMGPDLRHIFGLRDEENTDMISKQNLYSLLSDVLPPKSKDMLKDLQAYLPSGAPDFMVNYTWLLRDDLYVPSPLIFGLRLQHLEQVVDVSKSLAEVVKEASIDGKLTYKDAQSAIQENPVFFSVEVVRGFGVTASQIKPESEATVEEFMKRVLQSNIFPAVVKDAFEEYVDPSV